MKGPDTSPKRPAGSPREVLSYSANEESLTGVEIRRALAGTAQAGSGLHPAEPGGRNLPGGTNNRRADH